jgi:hypothetical protein
MMASSLLLSINIQFDVLMSSGVAHPLYPNTGTHSAMDCAVTMPKLSLVMLIKPFASLSILMYCSVFVRGMNIVLSCARFLRYCSSGPDPMIIRGNQRVLFAMMMRSNSFTKRTNLPIYT